jgi:formylglycine-generating enzyme required for sulfatase activity
MAMVDAFVEARLLTTSEGDQGGQVEVAHEALLRNWRRLAQWIQTVQSDLLLLRQLRSAAHEWATNGYKRDYLWLGERGVEVQSMLKRLRPTLDEHEQRFARPEPEHLIEELEDGTTTHIRREAIGQRLLALGDPRSGIGCIGGLPDISWCAVEPPKDSIQREFFDHEEKSFGTYTVHQFFVAKYPITNDQFQAFLDAKDGVKNADWWREFDEPKQEVETPAQIGSNYPRDSVSWQLAVAYSRWLSANLSSHQLPAVADPDNWEVRLPHEWEWQYAASGEDQTKEFPWGGWDSTKCNSKEAGIGRSMSIGLYPDGCSHCGALDMIGNVREWCLNTHKKPDTIEFNSSSPRALRGGSIYQDYLRAFTRYRASMGPKNPSREAGFRLAYAPRAVGTVGRGG